MLTARQLYRRLLLIAFPLIVFAAIGCDPLDAVNFSNSTGQTIELVLLDPGRDEAVTGNRLGRLRRGESFDMATMNPAKEFPMLVRAFGLDGNLVFERLVSASEAEALGYRIVIE